MVTSTSNILEKRKSSSQSDENSKAMNKRRCSKRLKSQLNTNTDTFYTSSSMSKSLCRNHQSNEKPKSISLRRKSSRLEVLNNKENVENNIQMINTNTTKASQVCVTYFINNFNLLNRKY